MIAITSGPVVTFKTLRLLGGGGGGRFPLSCLSCAQRGSSSNNEAARNRIRLSYMKRTATRIAVSNLPYRTSSVDDFEVWPPIATVIGLVPGVRPVGTVTLT